MKKTTKLTTKDIQKNITSINDSDVIPAELMKMLEDKMPDWLKEYEADGTAVVRWTFEWALLTEYLLQRDFGFSEDQIEKLNKRFKELLPEIAKMKVEIPRLLDKKDFHIVTEMVERNKQVFKAQKAGIALPESKKFIR